MNGNWCNVGQSTTAPFQFSSFDCKLHAEKQPTAEKKEKATKNHTVETTTTAFTFIPSYKIKMKHKRRVVSLPGEQFSAASISLLSPLPPPGLRRKTRRDTTIPALIHEQQNAACMTLRTNLVTLLSQKNEQHERSPTKCMNVFKMIRNEMERNDGAFGGKTHDSTRYSLSK